MMDHLVYWIWLSLRCGAGSELGSYLLSQLKTPKRIYDATEKELLSLEGIDQNIAAALMDKDITYAGKLLTYCERQNIGIMTLESEIYPERLRGIHAKPLVLYYRGRVPDIDDNVLISCVGTRKCSEAGRENAHRLGLELAAGGAVVVSGMALGIDTAAQRGALDGGGHTIAVLGCGIDRVYPAENARLMEEIAEKGTVLTEFAPGTDPSGKNFPIRNRILSGLSQGTVVVEADDRSGALITARYAERQGRDVFAYPGNAADALSAGTNSLIKNGARLVTSALDVLNEYDLLYPHRIFTERLIVAGGVHPKKELRVASDAGAPDRFSRLPKTEAPKKERPTKKESEREAPVSARKPSVIDTSALSEEEAWIVESLTETMSAEELSRRVSARAGRELSVGALLGTLTMLEIGGYVEALPGGSFRRAEEE